MHLISDSDGEVWNGLSICTVCTDRNRGNRSIYSPSIVCVSLVIQMIKSACETVCRSVRSVQTVKREFGPCAVRLCAESSSRHTLQVNKQPIHVYTYLHNSFYKRVQTNHSFLVWYASRHTLHPSKQPIHVDIHIYITRSISVCRQITHF